jgi:uncharacterized membrane protein YfcA
LKLLLLLLTATIGGAANALAGGGTFLVFPAMLLAGVPSVVANATASLIMMPGAIASAWVYRGTFGVLSRAELIRLTVVSLIGSAVGSILLLSTSNSTFSELVPWLLLMAAVVFTLAPRLRAAAAKSTAGESAALLLIGQFAIGVYGGYFGAGMGVLMIALFLIASSMTVQTANGIRLVCGSAINVLAVILFAWRGALDYRLGIPMLIAAVAGGYVGALLVSRLKESTARNAILTYAWALTIWFFARQFHVL